MDDIGRSDSDPTPSTTTSRPIEVTRADPEGCQGRSVEILAPQKTLGDEAVVVWDAALVLAHFLERHQIDLDLASGLHVVDVGAGTGAVGLTASALGANVTLTDLERALPLLEEGVRLNPELPSTGDFLRVLPLAWGDPSDVKAVCQPDCPPDLIVVADCVYYQASLAPLVFTLRELAKAKKAPVLLSYEVRDYSPEKKRIKDTFFTLVRKYFRVKEYALSDCHPTYSSEDIKMLRLDLI